MADFSIPVVQTQFQTLLRQFDSNHDDAKIHVLAALVDVQTRLVDRID